MQKFYGFDSAIGVGRNFGFKAGEAQLPLDKPVITSVNKEADMAGVRLEFSQFGDFDSFNVYRSDTPIDINALPIPVATLLPTMYYVDTTAIPGQSYYYRVAAIRGSDSMISDEQFFELTVITYPAFKWWRLINIKTRLEQSYRDPVEIVFYDKNQISLITNPNNAFAAETLPDGAPSGAFDNDPVSLVHNANSYTNATVPSWYVGYEFSEPQTVRYIGIQQRSNLPAGLGREFQTARVQVSDDGIVWLDYGTISPLITAESSTLKVVPVSVIDAEDVLVFSLLHYSFNGDVLDQSPSALNGVKTGNANFVAGRKAGTQALEFVAGCVRTPIALPVNSIAMTISFWLKTNSAEVGVIYEFSKNNNNSEKTPALFINNSAVGKIDSAYLVASVAGDPVYNIPSGAISVSGAWQHIIIDIDTSREGNQEQRIYVNNVLTSTYSAEYSFNSSGSIGNKVLYIGQRAASELPLKGVIQDLRVYNKTLSDIERLALFNE